MIALKDVSVTFRIPHQKRTTFFEYIKSLGMMRYYTKLHALRDITLSVERGETLGIIGENGSGKSTLLKVIASIIRPDRGTISVGGKITPFIELGAGFEPELTVRDNVFLYGAIMGMKKRQLGKCLPSILEFSELSEFQDSKLKNLSSGMMMRLAFSTAINVDPDILLIDEVLAVGDEYFQKKCLEKMKEFRKEGKTIVLVSHLMDTIKNFCSRAILLEKGSIATDGSPENAIHRYTERISEKRSTLIHERQKNIAGKAESKTLSIEEVSFLDKTGTERYIFKTGEPFIIRINYKARSKIEKPVFGIAIFKEDGTHINGPNTKTSRFDIDFVEGEGAIEYIVDSLPLLSGIYCVSASAFDQRIDHAYDYHDKSYKFRVGQNYIQESGGFVYMGGRWKIQR